MKENTIDQELFYYDKLKEIKSKQTRSSSFNKQENSSAKYNFGAKLVKQNNPVQFDGAQAAENEQEIPESLPDTVSGGKEGDNYAAFNKLKQEALERAKKTKGGIEKAEKVAKAAKTLKQVKNVKNLLNLAKAACGITLWGLIVTYLLMLVQFIGGNIFKSKYIPPLGMIEKLIFIPVSIILVISTLPSIIIPLAAAGIFGGTLAGIITAGQKVLETVGVTL